jgi:hypothetical protein
MGRKVENMKYYLWEIPSWWSALVDPPTNWHDGAWAASSIVGLKNRTWSKTWKCRALGRKMWWVHREGPVHCTCIPLTWVSHLILTWLLSCVCVSLSARWPCFDQLPRGFFDAGTWLNCRIRTPALQDLSCCIHETHNTNTQTHKQKNQVIWVFTETITTTQTVDRGAASVAELICTACQ